MGEKWTDEEIKGKILHKLTRLGKFSHVRNAHKIRISEHPEVHTKAQGLLDSHTSIDNLPKGFPPEIRGRVKDITKELKKEKILFSKPTSYGGEVSINPENREKIMSYINRFLEMK